MASKIVVIGGVNSAFKQVLGKLQKLQAKQGFAFALIVGDLFQDVTDSDHDEELQALLKGQIEIPLPTYFTVGSRTIPQSVIEKLEKEDEVCPNLYFLGKRGILTTSEGVKIVALGGKWQPNLTSKTGIKEKYLPHFTDSDCKALLKTENADILVTNQWPKYVQQGSKVPMNEIGTVDEAESLADLCSVLKPKYYFSSAAPGFFEREPFFHIPMETDGELKHVTRFLNIASFNPTSKQKWLYAFNLDPKAPSSSVLPAGATITPFVKSSRKREGLESQDQSFNRFSQGDDHRPKKRARRAVPDQSECFFCLSNPNIATHLITSIGSDCYLTIAKGPLTMATTFASLGFPGHILIIPLTHAPKFALMGDPDSTKSTYDEMQKYRSALQTMLDERSKGKLGAVTWEVSRGGGVHIHWQFLPVSSDMVSRGLVEAAFKVEAENLNYPKIEKGLPEDAFSEHDYFRVWIYGPASDVAGSNGVPSETVLTLPLSGNFRFNLQFGRIVMAKLLGLENRIDWRDASQPQSEEIADGEAFKEAFKKFDFSLDEK